MSNAVKQIAGGNDFIISNQSGTKLTEVERISLAAAAAVSTIEVFDGMLGVVLAAGVAANAAGTGYDALDVVTIASPAVGGTDIKIRIDTVGVGGEIVTFTVIQEGTGFVNAAAAAVTGGAGANGTFAITAGDTNAVSIAKISCIANTHSSQNVCVQTKNGTSVRVTGASAKGYIYHE